MLLTSLFSRFFSPSKAATYTTTAAATTTTTTTAATAEPENQEWRGFDSPHHGDQLRRRRVPKSGLEHSKGKSTFFARPRFDRESTSGPFQPSSIVNQ